MTGLVCVTPALNFRHGGVKFYKNVPMNVPEICAVYFEKLGWASRTPEAEAVDSLDNLTVDPNTIDVRTGKRVLG